MTDHQISTSCPDALQPRPVVLHIGASKTATTTLQRNVFSRLPRIVFLGKPFARERGVRDVMSQAESELLQRVVLQIERSRPDQDIHDSLASVRRIIDRLRQTVGGATVFSDERFCNDEHAPHEVVANRLHAAFGPAEVLLSIRSQFTALPSLYLHEMRTSLEPVAFSDWLSQALADPSAHARSGETIAQFRYDNLLAAFSRVFAGRVRVLLYEDLVSDRASFAGALAGSVRADSDQVAVLLSEAPRNATKSAAWYRYRRHYARIKAKLPHGFFEALPGFELLKRSFEKRLGAGRQANVVLSDVDRERIEDYYGADNRSLQNRLGLDLRKLSYPGCG